MLKKYALYSIDGTKIERFNFKKVCQRKGIFHLLVTCSLVLYTCCKMGPE